MLVSFRVFEKSAVFQIIIVIKTHSELKIFVKYSDKIKNVLLLKTNLEQLMKKQNKTVQLTFKMMKRFFSYRFQLRQLWKGCDLKS